MQNKLKTSKFKIASWNLNSVNARLGILLEWLESNRPDVVLLQELKCQNEKFPFQQLEDLGYNIAVNGQKSYNGVAILSKTPMEDIVTSFPNDPDPEQSRYIEAVVNISNKIIKVSSVYVPNGRDIDHDNFQYKLNFLEAFYQYNQQMLNEDQPIFIGGDFNVALEELDVFDVNICQDSIGFHLKERRALRKIMNIGFYDMFRLFNPSAGQFSWWDYQGGSWNKNQGLRIDYIFASALGADICNNCYIDQSTRAMAKTSDHAPVIIEIGYT